MTIIGYKVFSGSNGLNTGTVGLTVNGHTATIAIIERYTSIGDAAFHNASSLTQVIRSWAAYLTLL